MTLHYTFGALSLLFHEADRDDLWCWNGDITNERMRARGLQWPGTDELIRQRSLSDEDLEEEVIDMFSDLLTGNFTEPPLESVQEDPKQKPRRVAKHKR